MTDKLFTEEDVLRAYCEGWEDKRDNGDISKYWEKSRSREYVTQVVGDVVMREAVAGASIYPGADELRNLVVAYIEAVNHQPESGSDKAWRKHDKAKNDAFKALCKFTGL